MLVKVTVLDEKGQKFEHFPNYVPISLFARAKLKQNTILKLHDKSFNYKVRIPGFEDVSEKGLFKLLVFLIKKYIVYPDQPEPFSKTQSA